jgi:hypothetical protein
MKRVFAWLGAVIVALGAVYFLFVDPFKQSVLFRELLKEIEFSSNYTFKLLVDGAGPGLPADAEVNALEQDGFLVVSESAVEGAYVNCGSYKFSLTQPTSFMRVGDILRLDKYTYGIEIKIDDECTIYEATGSTGPVVAP